MRVFVDIDTQIDFLFPAGALYGAGAERVLPTVGRLNRFAGENGIPLISTMCAHPEDAREFRVWPPHCVVGTVGQQKPAATLLDRRIVVPNRVTQTEVGGASQILLEKDDLDMFSNPNAIPLLDRMAVDECFVYGVFTEYCVKCAVMGLLKTGRKVRLIPEATAHLSDAVADDVVNSFVAAGGECVSLSDVVG
jgi:nicotinamidase/pyrazinamidase